MPALDAYPFVASCWRTANRLVTQPSVGHHDLAGQIFNRLVADRKFLATFYTSIPAATILAGLALNPEKWPDTDWSDINAIRRFTVLDPACGTGTLLMAAYRQIRENYRFSASTAQTSIQLPKLHQTLIEDTIHGADVVDAGIHLTAATLASMSPEVKFEQMNLSVFPLEYDRKEGAKLGSLEWLEGDAVQATFSGTGTQVGPTAIHNERFVLRPKPDLVIANPPYTRSTGNDGDERRVFGHKPGTDQKKLSAKLSALIADTPAHQQAGLASVFLVLADQLLEENGRLAFVLPATALYGVRWAKIRQLISDQYQVEFVISVHDPDDSSLSYDTSVAEVLIIARKLSASTRASSSGRFVNLWNKPVRDTEALALTRAIARYSDSSVQRIDGPPLGATDIMLGNDKWGEIVDGPLGRGSWSGGQWKQSECGQLANSLAMGRLWNRQGRLLGMKLPIEPLEKIAGISPSHLQIKGGYGANSGAFNISEGWNRLVRYPALWHVKSGLQRGLVAEPNARLSPKPDGDVTGAWSHSGFLHITPDIGYTSQRVASATTTFPTLGVRMWHTLNIDSSRNQRLFESALSIWFNSSFGLLLHANHAIRSQPGRGLGSLTLLRSLPTLDVRRLSDWQLEAAEDVFLEMRDVEFQPFYMCAVDTGRINLDERLVREVLGLGDDAVDVVAHIRELLAHEPSIHGNKQPAIPCNATIG